MNPSTLRFVDNFSPYVDRMPAIVAEIKEVIGDMDASIKQISQEEKFNDIEMGYYESLNKNFQSLKKVLNNLNQDSYVKPLPKEAKESFQALQEDVKGLQLLYSTTEQDLHKLFKDFFAGNPNGERLLRQKYQLFREDVSKSRELFDVTENQIFVFLKDKHDTITPEQAQRILKLFCMMNNDFALNLYGKSIPKKMQDELFDIAEKSPDMMPSPEFLSCLKLAKELHVKSYKAKRKSNTRIIKFRKCPNIKNSGTILKPNIRNLPKAWQKAALTIKHFIL